MVYIVIVQWCWPEHFAIAFSFTGFINTMSVLIVFMYAYFQTVKGKPTGITFIDSTSLKVSLRFK